jgi:hypothetical protein
MFLPVRVGPKSRQLELISGELGFSNPIREAITEARHLYGADCKVSCVLSLGCGRPISTPEDPNQTRNTKECLLWNAAVTSQRTAQEMQQQIGNSKVYHRFSMERELESYKGISLDPGVITGRMAAYLAESKVSNELDTCVEVSLGGGECVLGNLCASVLNILCHDMLILGRSIIKPNVLLYIWNTTIVHFICYERSTHGYHPQQTSIPALFGSVGDKRNRQNPDCFQAAP